MTPPSPARVTPPSLLPSLIGAVIAGAAAIGASWLWHTALWPGRTFVVPAIFFAGLGATSAWTGPRWRSKPGPFKILVTVLYCLFGAVVVGGLSTFM